MISPEYSEQSLWGVLETPIFLVCHIPWQIQWCNQKASSLFGIDKGSIFSEVFPSVDQAKLIKRLESGRQVEFSVETKDRLFPRVTFILKQLSSTTILIEGRNDTRVLEAEAMSASYVKLVEQQKREILAEKELNEIAHASLRQASEQSIQSIGYASRIQRALLPSQDLLSLLLGDIAVWWEPRDIVGGDLYWASSSKDDSHTCSLALFDCTGHGVPGAFMTALLVPLIDTLNERGLITTPNLALAELDKLVRKRLGQDGSTYSTNDGLDMGICVLNRRKRLLEFAGAGIDLFLVRRNRAASRLVGNKRSLGYYDSDASFDWTSHSVSYEDGDVFLMCSDGFVTQPGGTNLVSLGNSRLLDKLSGLNAVTPRELMRQLQEFFSVWQGQTVRRDDITVMIFSP